MPSLLINIMCVCVCIYICLLIQKKKKCIYALSRLYLPVLEGNTILLFVKLPLNFLRISAI